MIRVTRRWSGRSVPALFAAAAMALAGGAAGASLARPRAEATRNAAIPFTEARVDSDDGRAFALTWSAPAAAGAVTVRARSTPGGDGPDGAGRLVGRGGPSGALTVRDLPPAARWYFVLTPRHGAPLAVADRALHLPTAPNFRDVGGYRTGDGRWVRMGLAFRSDQLDRLDEADLGVLARLAPAIVADLRTAGERRRGADRLPPGAEGLVEDVLADADTSGAGFLSAKTPEAAADLMIAANRQFVSLASARAAYAGLFARLTTTPGAVVYHCSAGKDRTGWASAVLLTALGVPRETVMADYLASNGYLTAKNRAMFAHMTPAQAANVEPVMTVRRAYLEAAFAEVDRRYGSFTAYLDQALGLDAAAVSRLKARFLEGAPSA